MIPNQIANGPKKTKSSKSLNNQVKSKKKLKRKSKRKRDTNLMQS
jgi:hypothetical protein